MSGPASGKGGKDLTQGPIASTLLLFAVPTLASNVLQSLNGSINAIWVGRFLGAQALAATANANIIMFLMFSVVFGFGMASKVVMTAIIIFFPVASSFTDGLNRTDRAILDAGSKALTSDLLGFSDYGMIVDYPEAVITGLSEEHGTVDLSKVQGRRPEIGEKVRIIPNHTCVVSNLFDIMTFHRDGIVTRVEEVAARGLVW